MTWFINRTQTQEGSEMYQFICDISRNNNYDPENYVFESDFY